MKHWTDALPRDACEGGLAWAKTQPDAETAWRTCGRGDWMLWLIGRWAGKPGSDKRRKLVLCCCDVVSEVRRYTRGKTRVAFDRCQRTARSWARGCGATLDDVCAAVGAAEEVAYAAGTVVYASAAAYAAYAYDAADVAAAADDVARVRALARCARIVRSHYPHPPTKGGE